MRIGSQGSTAVLKSPGGEGVDRDLLIEATGYSFSPRCYPSCGEPIHKKRQRYDLEPRRSGFHK